MEKVLDIDSIIGDLGFVVSSCNDEEGTAHISKAKRELSSRLATIFADDCRTASTSALPEEVPVFRAKEKSRVASSPTIFSSAVYLYLLQDGHYISKGRVGVAVVRTNSLIHLVFYNSSKEVVIRVPLGDGKIHRIEKQEKYCIVFAALNTLAFVCFNDEVETKLIALLMILCSIKSTVLERGSRNEVEMGSSVFYDSMTFTFDGTTVEVVAQQPSKLCLSSSSDSWMLCLLGLKTSGKCLIRLDDRTALAIHITEVKNNSKKSVEKVLKLKLSEEELSRPPGNLVTDVSNVEKCVDENSFLTEENINQETRKRMNTTELPNFAYTSPEKETQDSLVPSPMNSIDFRRSSDQQQYCSFTDNSCDYDVRRHDHEKKSDKLLTDCSVFHQIVEKEIGRLESRLQIAMERMVNGCMNSIKNEMIQIKEKQELLLEKLEDLRNLKAYNDNL